MNGTLLQTKLYIPPLRPNLVPRPQLVDTLSQGLQLGHKLTLISAPAGFGKTTLASEWVAGSKRPAAWVSLDDNDNDPLRFLTYVIAALQTIDAGTGGSALSILQSAQALPIELILTSIINDVAELPQPFILVLDDYHVISAQPVYKALAFLIDHLPAPMHLAIASRADPPLPLARLRARGELTELRAADLRFTPDEAAAFLNQAMGLNLSAQEIAALESRTEGWIAGLQMAALSMQGREDFAAFIQAFTGSHRFVLDYLVEEVLGRQPQGVRSFLLQTAVLDRLSGPLCDAVTGQENSKGMLADLERRNLFVVPLDDRRQWYRYHHLFSEVLQAHALDEQPDQAAVSHRRASLWYEKNDLPSEAIGHALAAKDFERAAALVELAWPAMRSSRREAAVLGWVKALPDDLFDARPVLCVVSAWALLDGGELEAAEARLQDAERWLDTKADAKRQSQALTVEMTVVDERQFRSLPASIANARAYRAQALGDVPGTITFARQAVDLMPESDYYGRGTTTALLGLAYWTSGDLEAAQRSFAEGLTDLQKGGGTLIVLGGTMILSHIRMAQGRLHDAASLFESSMQLATAQGEPVLQGTAELYLGLSELHYEWGDLIAAREHLQKGEALREQASLPGYEYLWCSAWARISAAQDDVDAAFVLLQEAEQVYYRSPIPDVQPIAAMKARLWAAQGRLAEAENWARERGLSVDDDLSYLREYEHITLARILIAQARNGRADSAIEEAISLLDRLLIAAEEGQRVGSVIEILILQALALQAQGDISGAGAPLGRALTLAEPQGYVRIFVDEGAPMADLLLETAARGTMPDYAGKLLAAFEAEERESQSANRHGAAAAAQPLAEPLSQRELEVLRLLRTDLSGPEIARELVIALSTVRTHTKSIYSKLDVNNRRAAVKRAAELDLI